MDFENTSAEMTEVAEPSTESVENQEVAEPEQTSQETASSGKTEADAAFAEMRRAKEAAERERDEARQALAEKEAHENARRSVFRSIGGSETADVDALAESLGVDTEDVLASINAEQEAAKKDMRIKTLEERVESLSAEKKVSESIEELKKLDPNITDINDLGADFVDYVGKGLSVEQAYYAVKGKELSTRSTPAKAPGKVKNEPAEKDFITEAEWDAMTPAQQKANWKLGKKSMAKW